MTEEQRVRATVNGLPEAARERINDLAIAEAVELLRKGASGSDLTKFLKSYKPREAAHRRKLKNAARRPATTPQRTPRPRSSYERQEDHRRAGIIHDALLVSRENANRHVRMLEIFRREAAALEAEGKEPDRVFKDLWSSLTADMEIWMRNSDALTAQGALLARKYGVPWPGDLTEACRRAWCKYAYGAGTAPPREAVEEAFYGNT